MLISCFDFVAAVRLVYERVVVVVAASVWRKGESREERRKGDKEEWMEGGKEGGRDLNESRAGGIEGGKSTVWSVGPEAVRAVLCRDCVTSIKRRRIACALACTRTRTQHVCSSLSARTIAHGILIAWSDTIALHPGRACCSGGGVGVGREGWGVGRAGWGQAAWRLSSVIRWPAQQMDVSWQRRSWRYWRYESKRSVGSVESVVVVVAAWRCISPRAHTPPPALDRARVRMPGWPWHPCRHRCLARSVAVSPSPRRPAPPTPPPPLIAARCSCPAAPTPPPRPTRHQGAPPAPPAAPRCAAAAAVAAPRGRTVWWCPLAGRPPPRARRAKTEWWRWTTTRRKGEWGGWGSCDRGSSCDRGVRWGGGGGGTCNKMCWPATAGCYWTCVRAIYMCYT